MLEQFLRRFDRRPTSSGMAKPVRWPRPVWFVLGFLTGAAVALYLAAWLMTQR